MESPTDGSGLGLEGGVDCGFGLFFDLLSLDIGFLQMDHNMQEFTFQQSNVIALMKDHVQAIEDASKTLDDKAQENINISSIIIAIVSALNITQVGVGQSVQQLIEQPIIVLIFVIYGVIFILSYAARFPRRVATHPLQPNWDKAQEWSNYSLEEYFDNLLSSYIKVIEDNEKVVARKAFLVRVASLLIGFDMFLIFAAIAL